MSLFTADITLTLTTSEAEVVTRPIVGSGGHQACLRAIVEAIRTDGRAIVVVTLSDQQLQKVEKYAYDYGSGGYQDRFRIILSSARRSGWQAPP